MVHTFTNDRIPKPFIQLVKYFFNEAKTIEEFWRMTQIAAYRGNLEKEKERVLYIAIDSFKQLIHKLKSSKKVQKPIAYFYGILEKKFDELYSGGYLRWGTANRMNRDNNHEKSTVSCAFLFNQTFD